MNGELSSFEVQQDTPTNPGDEQPQIPAQQPIQTQQTFGATNNSQQQPIQQNTWGLQPSQNQGVLANGQQPVEIQIDAGSPSVNNIQLCQVSRFPQIINCPYCLKTGQTRVDFTIGGGTYCCCILLLWSCFWWVPFLCLDCKDVDHYCSNCGALIGKCPYVICK